MDHESYYDIQPKSSVQLNYIVPIENLDLTNRLVFKGERVVSMGAHGDISRAIVTKEDRDITVAVKRLRVAERSDIKMLFEKELCVWKKLKHPNVLPLLGYAFDNQGYPLFLSLWMCNGSALDFVSSHPDCDITRLITGVAQGLAYLHSLNIVHSDIKPDNILISDDEDALISDFGYSRVMADSLTLDGLGGGVTGPPQYTAYELLTGLETDHTKETDVWAFGMTIYELFARKRAYAGCRPLTVVLMVAQMRLPSFPSNANLLISPEMSKRLWEICQLCWKQDPLERADMNMILEKLSSDVVASEAGDEQCIDENHPLRYVAPEILAVLKHLDLTDRYLFKESKAINGGAYGDVCKGFCDVSGSGVGKVAIKTIRFYLKEDVKMLFEKEICVWAKLNHPNILPLLGYAFDTQTGYPLLVSEWMENGSAWDFVRSHPDCDLMRIVLGIARGLEYLHERGVVHSDMKSDNILISNTEDALICDFGCSRMLDSTRTFANLSSEVKGTLQYLAYELISDPRSKCSTKTDIWAFGMTVFELLTRQRPYAGSDTEVIAAISRHELPALPLSSTFTTSPEVRQKLWEICQICWVHEPEHRADMNSIVKKLVDTGNVRPH